jgi:hypothetical protein
MSDPQVQAGGDPDCERCDGSGLDPDAFFVDKDRTTWTHAPCSECLPEDDDIPQPATETTMTDRASVLREAAERAVSSEEPSA